MPFSDEKEAQDAVDTLEIRRYLLFNEYFTLNYIKRLTVKVDSTSKINDNELKQSDIAVNMDLTGKIYPMSITFLLHQTLDKFDQPLSSMYGIRHHVDDYIRIEPLFRQKQSHDIWISGSYLPSFCLFLSLLYSTTIILLSLDPDNRSSVHDRLSSLRVNYYYTLFAHISQTFLSIHLPLISSIMLSLQFAFNVRIQNVLGCCCIISLVIFIATLYGAFAVNLISNSGHDLFFISCLTSIFIVFYGALRPTECLPYILQTATYIFPGAPLVDIFL